MNKKIKAFYNKNLPTEIMAVKSLGEQIGYGHLMELASALWRKKLQQSNTPITGATVPASIYDLKEEVLELVKKNCKIYDSIIKEYNHE